MIINLILPIRSEEEDQNSIFGKFDIKKDKKLDNGVIIKKSNQNDCFKGNFESIYGDHMNNLIFYPDFYKI